ncbi:hypothetical protein [Azospirillum argentinense]
MRLTGIDHGFELGERQPPLQDDALREVRGVPRLRRQHGGHCGALDQLGRVRPRAGHFQALRFIGLILGVGDRGFVAVARLGLLDGDSRGRGGLKIGDRCAGLGRFIGGARGSRRRRHGAGNRSRHLRASGGDDVRPVQPDVLQHRHHAGDGVQLRHDGAVRCGRRPGLVDHRDAHRNVGPGFPEGAGVQQHVRLDRIDLDDLPPPVPEPGGAEGHARRQDRDQPPVHQQPLQRLVDMAGGGHRVRLVAQPARGGAERRVDQHRRGQHLLRQDGMEVVGILTEDGGEPQPLQQRGAALRQFVADHRCAGVPGMDGKTTDTGARLQNHVAGLQVRQPCRGEAQSGWRAELIKGLDLVIPPGARRQQRTHGLQVADPDLGGHQPDRGSQHDTAFQDQPVERLFRKIVGVRRRVGACGHGAAEVLVGDTD